MLGRTKSLEKGKKKKEKEEKFNTFYQKELNY